jgi:integrase
MRIKLTDQLVKTLPAGLYWDQDERAPDGFVLQVTSGGSRVFRLNYRRQSDNRERRITLGDLADFQGDPGSNSRRKIDPIDRARAKAAELRRAIGEGRDPLGEREERRAAPTVAELAARYMKEDLPRLAPATQAMYRSLIEQRILPELGERKVAAITRDDVVKLHRTVSAERNEITGEGKKRRANASKGMLSILLNKAVEWGWRDDNPARFVKGHTEHGRERYLSPEEIARLFEQLDKSQAKQPDACDGIRLALLTGARRGEILGMRWADLDLGDKGIWTKPPGLTKQRRLHRVPLSAEAIDVLHRRLAERAGVPGVVRLRPDGHVFKGGGVKEHTNRFEAQWRNIRAAAGLEDCRFHDLRHSYASLLVGKGLSLPIIGAMLGHAKSATTQRYAHLADAPLREAAAIVGRIVGGGKHAK